MQFFGRVLHGTSFATASALCSGADAHTVASEFHGGVALPSFKAKTKALKEAIHEKYNLLSLGVECSK